MKIKILTLTLFGGMCATEISEEHAAANSITINSRRVVDLTDDLKINDAIQRAKNEGFDGISFKRSQLADSELVFPDNWLNEFIIRFNVNNLYYMELIASPLAELKNVELCKEAAHEPGIRELLKSEDKNTLRLMIYSKESDECIGGAIIEKQSKFQPYLTLLALYILPKYRSKGLSNILLDKISYLAFALKAQGVRLQPFPLGEKSLSKDELIQWYERRKYYYPPNPTRLSYMINDSFSFSPNRQERITVLF